MIEQTHEEIVESMKIDPYSWAELYIEQITLITTLETMLEEYQTRLAILMYDPEENTQH